MRRTAIAALFLTAAAAAALADPAGGLQRARLSAELYAQGLAEGDALTILTAASLRKSAGIAADPAEALSWQAMLAAAEPLAAGDAVLEGLIADIAAEGAKGVITGAVQKMAELPPGETVLPALEFKGGTTAEVYVEAAPGTDLNLTVRDAAGNLVCRDTDPSFVAYCNWTPARDGSFTLTVENRGSAPIDYALMTN